MNRIARTALVPCAAAVVWWPLFASPPASADETRAHARPVPEARGLVVAIADSSAAASASLALRPAFPGARAPGCPAGRVYWRRGLGPPPPCDSPQWVALASTGETSGLRCAAALGPLRMRGFHVARRLRQWDPVARQWAPPAPGSRGALECAEDSGRHGAQAGTWYAADGTPEPWSRSPGAEVNWDEDAAAYTLYAGGYVGTWHSPVRASTTAWSLQRSALAPLGDSEDYDLALLRHSWNGAAFGDEDAEGGMVVVPAHSPARVALAAALQAIEPGGGAPWTETLYESARYLRADAVDFGRTSRASPTLPQPSVAGSRAADDPTRYASPWPHACTRAHVLAIAAGAPSQDASGRANALALPGFGAECRGWAESPCLPDLLRYLESADHSRLPGHQRASVAWWPLGASERAPGAPLDAAERWAVDASDRPDALPLFVAGLAQAAYAAPAVTQPAVPSSIAAVVGAPGTAVAGGFVPGTADRWRGTLVRIALSSAGNAAPGTEFRPAPPPHRRLYTDLAGGVLTAGANAIAVGNAALSPAALGLAPAELARRERTIAWARGIDTEDADADGDRSEMRGDLGAIVGGSVAVVRHAAGTRVYAGTGDGWLHAFTSNGEERWAFVPRAFLGHLDELRAGRTSGTRHAGLDGEVRVLAVDRNADGVVDPRAGERALLYLGLRRGGRAYLAIDVTEPDAPRRLWSLGPRELPALGQTWATPVPARLTIAGSGQNAERRVVLLAGGHDPAQDVPRGRTRDRVGAALYLVDAYSGALLWHASARTSDVPDLVVPALDYAVAATPRALDLDEDGELDRAYVADTGGRVFRFEFHGGSARGSLATATLLADLGGAGSDDRRFYAEPDVALVRIPRALAHLAITLGSGFAPDPNASDAANRLYSIRDELEAVPGTSSAPRAALTDAALPVAGAGTVPIDARGWKLPLDAAGERILVGARTVDHRVYVPAYVPPSSTLAPDCTQPPGSNRLHALDVRDGRRVSTRTTDSGPDDDAVSDADALPMAGVAPAVAVLALARTDCTSDCPREVVGLVGLERIDVRWPGRIVRTGWAEREVE